GACVEQDDKGWDARKRAYCLKIQPATGSFARNLIYSTKPVGMRKTTTDTPLMRFNNTERIWLCLLATFRPSVKPG
ncbi:hypothetical protein M3B44_17650, partial [Klebsiella quasipneumoniae]|uniref:hypothetical protein n=1 Tax=Klebsiella quasipneumoniae TaxID=1463165 RepID=UPI002AB92D29